MDRKFFKGIIVGAVGALTVFVLVLGILTITGKLQLFRYLYDGSTVTEASSTATSAEFNTKVKSVFALIEKYYYKDISQEELEKGMLSGLAEALDDPYAHYYTEEEFAELTEEVSGVYSGIGAVVTQNMTTGEIKIVRPYPDSPAYKAGMISGDIVRMVDGNDVTGLTLDEVVAKIKGVRGTTVVVSVEREGETGLVDLTITRDEIETVYVSSKMLENDIGYVRVDEIEDKTVSQFEKALEDLKKAGMKSLIIDMRDNPGGLYDKIVEMADLFLDKDELIVYTVDKNGVRDEERSKTDKVYDLPIAILVNNYSASAAEIFTGTLKDHGVATVIGEKTYGKGIVQFTFGIGSGKEAFKFTSARYYLPSGVCIHEVGIEPDIESVLDEDQRRLLIENRDHDNQLEAAIEYLSK